MPPSAAERRRAHARPGAAAGRRRRQRGVREPAQVRSSTRSRRRPRPIILFIDEAHTMIGAGGAGRARRRRQPAQAGPGARRAAHDRRHDLGRIQEVLREGRGADPPLPGGQGRGAGRGDGHRDDARPRRDAREAPRRAHPRRGGRGGGSALRPLHPRPPASRQVGAACSTRPAPAWRSARSAVPPAIEDRQRRIALIDTRGRDRHPRSRNSAPAPTMTSGQAEPIDERAKAEAELDEPGGALGGGEAARRRRSARLRDQIESSTPSDGKDKDAAARAKLERAGRPPRR